MPPSSKLKINDSLNHHVDIFSFTDYRKYLRTVYADFKKNKRYFSYRYFSELAGFGGKNYLQMVMDGKRNLSLDSINKFCHGLHLSKREAAYFETMVLFNQTKSEEEKDRYFAQLIQLRPKTQIEGISEDQYEYLTNSLYVILREMSALPEFNENVEWIKKNLCHDTRPSEIKKALELLERLKLLVRDKNNTLRPSGKTLETPENAQSLEILDYHRQILNETKEALINIPYDERDINSMTIPIPRPLLPVIKDLLRKCREDIVHLVNQSSHDYYEVFQINSQFFPVTQTKAGKK